MKNKQRKWRIKSRIFIMLLLLLAVVFSSVFFSFNLFIGNYMRSNVEAQLNDLIKNYGTRDDKPHDGPQDDFSLPDVTGQPKNKIGIRGEVFSVDANYEIKGYDSKEDIDELTQIASYLHNKNVRLENAGYVSVRTEQNEYYISSVEDPRHPGRFLIFYVSATGLNNLVDMINLALGVIVAAAMVICFIMAGVIAGSVTTPVKKLSKFAVEIGKGNFTRNEFLFQDIEFIELGEAMNQSAEKLDLYDKDQQTFFQNVSHELRTPLMSIRCYAEGIEYGLMEPKKSSATIIAETDRLSELVEDILYISRVDNITNQIEKHVSDLRDTLSLCAERLKPVAAKNGLRIEYQFSDDPVLFTYNEKHMYRAFVNLISNALRYAGESIILRCRQTVEQIEICVIDDGEGVSPEDIPFIFERFYKGKSGKHGIGLSIVKAVVELHGGEIMVDCAHGTCFTIVFSKKASGS